MFGKFSKFLLPKFHQCIRNLIEHFHSNNHIKYISAMEILEKNRERNFNERRSKYNENSGENLRK